jgi:hypothetical protein
MSENLNNIKKIEISYKINFFSLWGEINKM